MKKYLINTAIILALFTTAAYANLEVQKKVSDGALLYQQNCARCHGKLEKTRIPDRSTRRITSAIKNLGVMGKLKHLSSQQIEAIAGVLESAPMQLTRR